MSDETTDLLTTRIVGALDEHAATLSAADLARLRQARQRALAPRPGLLERLIGWALIRPWQAAGTMAAVATTVLSLSVLLWSQCSRVGGRQHVTRWPALSVALLLVLGASAASAGIRWEDLSPDEQRILGRTKERWRDISPDEQQRLRRGAERWQQLSPDQRQGVERLRELPPQDKQRIQRQLQDYRQMPPEDRDRLKQQQDWYRTLPDDRKQQLNDQWQRSPRDGQRHDKSRNGDRR
ncbi:MAG: DUF3106 domain-containing protein [Gammaproteobacteria bacterium]|nr:DUF3106 domain-containing protein [Gammaproteobacteria bacterium]